MSSINIPTADNAYRRIICIKVFIPYVPLVLTYIPVHVPCATIRVLKDFAQFFRAVYEYVPSMYFHIRMLCHPRLPDTVHQSSQFFHVLRPIFATSQFISRSVSYPGSLDDEPCRNPNQPQYLPAEVSVGGRDDMSA